MFSSAHLENNHTWNITQKHHSHEESLPQEVVIIFNIIAALTILANSFHLTMITGQKRLQKLAYYNYKLFLLFLGCADLALAVVRIILSNNYMQNLLEEYNIFCAATAAYLHITYTSMISVIVMVSIDRAFCLKQSITYQSRPFVKRYPKIIILVVVFFAAVYVAMAVIFHDSGFSTKDVGTCNFGSHKIPILAAPTVLLILLYLFIITAVYLYVIVLTRRHIAQSKNTKEKRRITEVTKTIGAIIIGSALCWLPPIASAVLWGIGIPSVELEIYALIMLEFNSLANPLLYGLANKTYRALVYKRISRWWSRLPTSRVAPETKEISTPSTASTSM